jgi:hypothetical protein
VLLSSSAVTHVLIVFGGPPPLFLQYLGMQQGSVFDPDTMEPLLNTPATVKVLQVRSGT